MSGRDGRDGRDGAEGPRGFPGERGPKGDSGARGQSAYESAVARGFTGSERDWLASLLGRDGKDGKDGEKGVAGERGEPGERGAAGRDGANGKDGAQGPRGPQGPQGEPGPPGPVPLHEWRGAELRFELPGGVWGEWVDLQGPPGKRGRDGGGGAAPSATYSVFTVALDGLVPGPSSATGAFLRDDGTWQPVSGSGTVTSIDITAPAAGITSSGGPVTTSGAITLALANDLAALEALSGTGWAKRTGADTWALAAISTADVSGLGTAATHAAGDFDAAGAAAAVSASLAAVATSGSAADLWSGTLPAGRLPALTGDAKSSAGSATTTVATTTIDAGIVDQAYSGAVVSATYGASLVPGDAVYFENDGSVHKADADGTAGSPLIAPYPCMGLALETASSGSHKVLLFGLYRDDSRFTWNGGGVLYLSTTAGAMVQTAPSATDNVVQVLGVALSAHVVFFRPSLDYLTHS